MEDALTLSRYLPISYKRRSDQEYISFLWSTFHTNYEGGHYHFAFLAYHMLFMSFVYFNIWQIRNNLLDDFKKALTLSPNKTESDFIEATSPFTFRQQNERSVFGFLKLVGCSKTQIGQYKRIVDERNEAAHANGNIYLDNEEALDRKIEEYLKYADEIQGLSEGIIHKCYGEFVAESFNEETREFTDFNDQVREILIHQQFLSLEDVRFCLGLNTNFMETLPDGDKMMDTHQSFCDLYSDEFEEVE